MATAIRESVDITSLIKNILNSYPAGNPILRELLQNSDDAGAKEQTFILDRRSHPTKSLLDPDLEDTQGPALLAVNDKLFSDSDWSALVKINGSNKGNDEGKTGKYGLGFRSCYHLTDNPQVLSGDRLQIFDPHDRFAPAIAGGAYFNIVDNAARFSDQISGFDSCDVRGDTRYSKTAVRLPLRTHEVAQRSAIRKDTFTPDDIRSLFEQFVREEASEILLFLRNITKITFKDVSQLGNVESCATIEIHGRNTPAGIVDAMSSNSYPVMVATTVKGKTVNRRWRLFHYAVTRQEAVTALRTMTRRPKVNFREDHLAEDKLVPHIGLAAPLEDPKSITGSLFTYLPLPIHPGFHVCIHGCFALMPDRQGLRNKSENTMGERETLLVTWNRFIFEKLVPLAWANLLQKLVQEKEGDGSWDLWPIVPVAKKDYWVSLLSDILKIVKDRNLKVFPTMFSPTSYVSPRDLNALFAPESTESNLAATLSNAGLNIIQPPALLIDAIRSIYAEKILNPAAAARGLSSQHAIGSLSEMERSSLLEYLLSESCSQESIERLQGMPLIPIAGATPSWRAIASRGPELLIPPSIVIEEILSAHSKDMISLSRLPTERIRNAFIYYRLNPALRIRALESRDVLTFLQKAAQSWTRQSTLSSGMIVDEGVVTWLVKFWNTISSTLLPERRLLASLYLLPTNDNSIARIEDNLFLPAPFTTSLQFIVWKKLGVTRFVHPNLMLPNTQLEPHLSRDLSHLLKLVDISRISSLSPNEWEDIRNSIIVIAKRNSPRLSPREINTLINFKIFRIWKGDSQTSIEAASQRHHVVSVSLSKCPLPTLPSSPTLIQYSSDNRIICHILTGGGSLSILGEPDLLGLVIKNWECQTTTSQPGLLGRIFARFDDLTSEIQEIFLAKRFVTVVGDTLKKATDVVDPESPIFDLYLASEPVGPTGLFASGSYGLRFLRARGYLLDSLTPNVVKDRIDKLSASVDASRFHKLRSLVRLLNANWRAAFANIIRSKRDVDWIPCRVNGSVDDEVLCAPQGCRDILSNVHLFDLHLQLASIDRDTITNTQLRAALGWEQPFTFDQLRLQLEKTLSHPDHHQDVSRFKSLIKEFSKQYQLDPDIVLPDINILSNAYSDAEWIPTASGDLVAPEYCLLQSGFKAGPFKHVSLSLNGCRDVLLKLGCSDKPSVSALLKELESHATGNNLSNSGKEVVMDLIRELARCDDLAERSFYLPCFDDRWQPRELVYYGGPSHASMRVIQGVHYYQLHRGISADIARSLGVRSHEDIVTKEFIIDDEEDSSDDELQESLLGRIGKLLNDYNVEFAFNELLANALDAGATEFRMVHDQRSFKRQDALTERLADIICGPALLIHNNAKFEEEDFKGLGKLGRGSKRERQDADVIGRYGLGATTLYHFTDVPIVISNNHILFLDPSQTYLTPREIGKGLRTMLRLTLADFNRLYPEMMERLNNVFGFSQKKNYYDGSIFWLPLTRGRGSCFSQHPRTALDIILRGYEKLGRNSFFFTRIELIHVGFLSGDPKVQNYWEIKGSREQVINSDALQIKLTSSHPKLEVEHWLLTQDTFQTVPFPEEYNDVFNGLQVRGKERGLRLREAIRLLPPSVHHDDGEHFLFSTLQLPIKLQLPFHLHAPFALPSNRGGIFLDPDNLEGDRATASGYNRWLLRELVPRLHAKTLATILSIQPESNHWQLWPIQQEGGEIAQIIADGFFTNLHSFPDVFIKTMSDDFRSPMDSQGCSFALEDVPSSTKLLLEAVNAAGVSAPPPSIAQQVGKNPNIKRLDATAIANILRGNSGAIQDGYKEGQLSLSSNIDDTLLYLLKFRFSDAQNDFSFDGLPLLISARGSLKEFDDCEPLYITRPMEGGDFYRQINELVQWIGEDRTISHTFHPRSHYYLYEHSQSIPAISRLSVDAVAQILEGRLGRLDVSSLNQVDANWVSMFFDLWPDIFHSPELKPTWDDLSDFPLLDTYTTTKGQSHVSLRALERGDALYHINFPDDKIPQLLTTMGISMIRSPDHIQALMPKSSLDANERARKLAKLLVRQPDVLRQRIARDLEPLAAWLRENIKWKTIKELSPELMKLPIWEAMKDGKDGKASLEEIRFLFLPEHVELGNEIIRRYFAQGDYVAYVPGQINQSAVENKRLNLAQLHQLLDPKLPTHLELALISPYASYLGSILTRKSDMALRAPTQDGHLRPLEDLYDPSVPLFTTILRRRDILHQIVYRQLNNGILHGLFHQSVNVATFSYCGRVYNRNFNVLSTKEQEEQAKALYGAYKDSLPREIMSSPGTWKQLDDIKFILRRPDRCRHASNFVEDNFCNDLPRIISPSQIVQEKHQKIAWTQRGIPLDNPSSDLLQLNVDFGVPTVVEVVAHLRCLATIIAPRHPQNISLYGDILATYKWLNEKSETTVIPIAPDEILFLNVNKPKSDKWEWVSASQLMFSLVEDTDTYQKPRSFLCKFKNLLLAANVQEVTSATLAFEQPDVDGPNAMKSRNNLLNEMRQKGQLVDGYFKPELPSDGEVDSSDREQLGFHRLHLATLSNYFRDMFTSGWGEERQREFAFEGTVNGCRAFLEYAYLGEFDIKVQAGAEGNDARTQTRLYELFLLLNFANLGELVSFKRVVIKAIVNLINPHTYLGICEMAALFDAPELGKSCEIFAQKNKFLDKISQPDSWKMFFEKRRWLYDCGVLVRGDKVAQEDGITQGDEFEETLMEAEADSQS